MGDMAARALRQLPAVHARFVRCCRFLVAPGARGPRQFVFVRERGNVLVTARTLKRTVRRPLHGFMTVQAFPRVYGGPEGRGEENPEQDDQRHRLYSSKNRPGSTADTAVPRTRPFGPSGGLLFFSHFRCPGRVSRQDDAPTVRIADQPGPKPAPAFRDTCCAQATR
jgi:hypothetical protein